MTSPLAPTLYISYDGVLEALGESQVVAYLERLASSYQITLISFEKPRDWRDAVRAARMRTRLTSAGIRWKPLKYHKSPPVLSTAVDILRGIWSAFRWQRQTQGRIVHVRGYVPAMMGLALKRLQRTTLLFDMRGFWADEKADAGHWKRGSFLYRVAKRWERAFFESADAIVSLTEAGVKVFPELGYRLPSGIPIKVIPTCADLKRFTPGPRRPDLVAQLGLSGHLVIGCVGTMSNWYLRQPMLDYLAFLLGRMPSLKALIVTAEDLDRLGADARRSGIAEDRLVLMRADFDEMPELMRLIDVGMFFIKPVFSKKGSAATKLAEFLASGVPLVINDGVGDSGCIVKQHSVGVVLPSITAGDFEASFDRVRALFDDPDVRLRCRAAAEALFDVEVGAASYRATYQEMMRDQIAGGCQ